jgi:hypothetical protein
VSPDLAESSDARTKAGVRVAGFLQGGMYTCFGPHFVVEGSVIDLVV